jgi:CubicO group peptidase (beta-lactamase class C family)
MKSKNCMYCLRLMLLFFVFTSGKISAAQSMYFPPKTGIQWDTISPNRLDWCSSGIDSLEKYLQSTHTDAFIILKDGKIVLEKYFGSFTQDSVHYWASAGKGLTAMLAGIAQQKGLLNISDSVSRYLGTGWTSAPGNKERLITVRHLLAMNSGLDDTPAIPCTNDDTSPACLQYLSDAGSRWSYHNAAYLKLQDIISAAAGSSYNAVTNQYIDSKIGMNGFWFNGTYFSKARDMARFGLLTLNKGIWQSDTILNDTSFFRAMTNTSQNLNLSYGYLWWLNGKNSFMLPGTQLVYPSRLIPNAPADMYCALGKNDQKIYVVPSQQLVVIRMGESAYGIGAAAFSPYDTLLWHYINKLSDGCTLTSVSKNKADIDFRIFPNPARNFISFSGFSDAGMTRYSIVNLYGQTLLEDETHNHSIDISALASGQYILTLENEQSKSVKQFIKN